MRGGMPVDVQVLLLLLGGGVQERIDHFAGARGVSGEARGR
jgi:hypothetical protein